MPSFVLPIFPRYGFDQSVTTPVLLGVLISWFFTETFGWVFAGLVVPGYLAAVFLLDAPGGVIDVFEAVLTYAVARFIGEHLSRTGLTTRFFGRERFFLVVVVSILVRLAVEAWILPQFVRGVWAYSVGLVVVPLAANACWKTGLVRGAVQNGVPTLLVYLILRYVLTPYTNLSLAGFELATQNVAASFLSSPKAYIVIVTGALLAAGANVRYGWDFNGILVPALLGLALFKPTQFVATFAETVVLYLTVLLLIRLTPLRKANIEGPRRTVLFFTVDYALRFAFAGALGSHVPGEDIVSYTGFGYLLPTLMAVKISQKGSVPLILLPTLCVSTLGFAAATLLGYSATLFDVARQTEEIPAFSRVMPPPPQDPAAAALWASALAIESGSGSDLGLAFGLSSPLTMFQAAASGQPALANRAGFATDTLADGVLLLRERFEAIATKRGLPTYLYRATSSAPGVVLLVKDPQHDAACAAVAGRLVGNGSAEVAVIAGVSHPSDSWLETSAHSAARLLAEQGLLVSLSCDPREALLPPHPAAAEIASRADAALPKLRKGLGLDVGTNGPLVSAVVDGRELRVVLDGVAIATELAPPRAEADLRSSTAIAMALDEVRPSTVPPTIEHLVALRRLVLEPLLGPKPEKAEAPRALVPFAAAMLGYNFIASTPGPSGHDVVALFPKTRGLPIALVARSDGVGARLLEAPMAARRGVRDLAIRLFVALDADALVLGEAWRGGMRFGAVREAQAAATDRATPSIFYVRGDEASGAASAELASWMDDGRASEQATSALLALGVAPERRELDPDLREIATRTLLRASPLVSITAGPRVEQLASLDVARRAALQFGGPGGEVRGSGKIDTVDGSVASAARLVNERLGAGGPLVSDDFPEVARRAASEGSVVSEHALARVLSGGAAKAVLLRSGEGTFLVAAARALQGRLLVVLSIEPRSEWVEDRRPWASCLASPMLQGTCIEAAP